MTRTARDHFDCARSDARLMWAERAMSAWTPDLPMHPSATDAERKTAREKARRDALYRNGYCPFGNWTYGQPRPTLAARLPIWC
jgi:hypothetical protein